MLCSLPNRRKSYKTLKVSDYIQRLEHAEIENAQQESLWLISHALGVSHSVILSRENFSDDECAKIESVISRRINGEPLQYILGEADFYGRDFHVGRGVLIPRQDTETLIDAMKFFAGHDESFYFADWGTGSGCIAITILLEFPRAEGYLLEASSEASRYAQLNIERWGVSERAHLVSSPEAPAKCKVLVSNPPYIPSGEIEGLMREVRDFEPHSALDGGEDGMRFYGEIFSLAGRLGCELVVLETGSMNQVESLRTFSQDFELCDEVMDSSGFPRGLVFRRRQLL